MSELNIVLDPAALYLLVVFGLLNLTAFFIMLADKVKSTRAGARRISEGAIFFLATVLGAIGVYAGMFAFRHKTRRWSFLLGIPLLIIQNAATIYVLYLLLNNR
ncbi:MAG: DUF1294 domain-containing protein [Candidatus Komeilibacteria bacterium]|nr:DUF1294 domain-containing protein [Candidatus Komeilibacteria bacterium]